MGVGQVPRSPHDQKVFDSQQNDALGRYREMANWSLEQRNAYLDSLPEGQRPIQTIRGNTEGWYNPSLSKEFSGLPQALTGVEGRPTLQSENMREQEARDRVSHEGIAGARNATAKEIASMRIAGENERATKGGKQPEYDFKEVPQYDDLGNEKGKKLMAINKHAPAEHYSIDANMSSDLAGKMSQDFTKDQNSIEKWAHHLNAFDSETRLSAMSKLSQEHRNKLRAIIEGNESKKNKK